MILNKRYLERLAMIRQGITPPEDKLADLRKLSRETEKVGGWERPEDMKLICDRAEYHVPTKDSD